MSDEVYRAAQRAAIQAQLQINDLGNANRNFVFTVDPTHREVSERRVLAMRECNDETTEAFRLATANRPSVNAWCNYGNSTAETGDADDDDLGGRPAHGQSHRVKLSREIRASNRVEDRDHIPPPNVDAINHASHPAAPPFSGDPARDPPRDPTRNSRRSGHPASRNTRGQQANRPRLHQSISNGPNQNTPPQNVVTQTRGMTQSSTSQAPPNPSSARLTPQTSGPVAKKRPLDSALAPIAESSQKRTYRYSSESKPNNNGLRPPASNRGPSRTVETTSYQDSPRPASKSWITAGQGSRPAALTATSDQSSRACAWTGPLQENPVAVLSTTSPANLSTEAQMRENPATARLFEAVPITHTRIQLQPAALAVVPQEPARENPNVMDTDLDRKELEELSASFAAMEVTPRPPIPTVSRPVLAASRYATITTPPGSVTSTTPAPSQVSREYEAATSSEAAFWKWKATQKPKRSGC